MSITNLTLLSETIHGQASGNYDGSSLDFNGNGVKAVGYYRGQGNLETVSIRVTGFQGLIILQATLDFLPGGDLSEARWFDVYEYGDVSSSITDFHPVNITGNFTWIRAKITFFESGTINSITTAY